MNDEIKQSTHIKDLDLTVRAYNFLKRAGIYDLKELSNMYEEELFKDYSPILREKAIRNVKEKMLEHNITFKNRRE